MWSLETVVVSANDPMAYSIIATQMHYDTGECTGIFRFHDLNDAVQQARHREKQETQLGHVEEGYSL